MESTYDIRPRRKSLDNLYDRHTLGCKERTDPR